MDKGKSQFKPLLDSTKEAFWSCISPFEFLQIRLIIQEYIHKIMKELISVHLTKKKNSDSTMFTIYAQQKGKWYKDKNFEVQQQTRKSKRETLRGRN